MWRRKEGDVDYGWGDSLPREYKVGFLALGEGKKQWGKQLWPSGL